LDTTIRISKETRKRLGEIGSKNQTFNDIIKELIERFEQKKEEFVQHFNEVHVK